jgi:hypothetical protein
MAQSVLLARASRQPNHSGGYAIGPYQVSKRAPDPDEWGIQFGFLALDGPSIFGERIDHDWSCAISSQAVGCFCRRFPRGHGGAQPALGAIHNEQILYANDQASHCDGPI